MAAEIGDIAVRVGADITDLKRGFSDASNSVGSFANKAGSQLRDVTGSLVKMGAAAAAAGAAALTALYVDASKSIDAQAKLAQALQGTIGGLRAVEMAAGDAGVSGDELNSMLVKLNQRMGEAERGTGAAFDALESLGLTAKDFSGLDIDQKLIKISDRVSGLGLSSQQTAAILKDLGIKNENMANMIRNGSDAIKIQSKEVADLGLNLSMVDAAKIEMANDALGIFGDVLTGIQDRLAVAVAPYITVLSEQFRGAAIESGGFKNEIEATINSTIKGFGYAGDAMQGFRVVLKGIELIMVGVKGAAISLAEVLSSAFTAIFDGFMLNINRIINKLNELTNSDIANIDSISDSEFMKGIHKMGDDARTQVGVVRGELHEMAMQEMPSDKITKFLADVTAASEKAAEATVTARAAIGGNDSVSTAKTDEKEKQDKIKKDESELEAIKNRYITEEELLRQHRELMTIIGDEFDASKFESEAQWISIREQAESEHLQKMQDLNRSAYDGIQGIMASRWGNATASTAGAMKSILGTMASGSKKAFEVSRAWAMADALISTYQGIAAGVKLGFPLGVPAVAWAAATGFAQVSQIKNQQFGGAGGAAASGGGSPAPAPNPVGVGGATSGGGGGGTYRFEGLNSGSFVSSDMVVEMLKQAQKDGALRGQIEFAA